MKLMLLHLINDQDKVECALLDQQQNIIFESKDAPLDEVITNVSEATQIILVVSGFDVIAIEKNLPKMPQAKLIKALPFAVEDQLLEPVDNYHFVITHTQDNGTVTLLAVLRSKMQQWLLPFSQHMTFSVMLPDYLLLPYETDNWHITIEKNVLIRTGLTMGTCCDFENWQQIIMILWNEQPLEKQPKKLVIHDYSFHQKGNIDTSLIQSLPIIIEQKYETTSLIGNMARQIHHEIHPVSLLVNEFAQEHHLSAVKKIWLYADGLLGIAVIISVLSIIIQFVALKHQDNILQTQIIALYKQIYPQSSSVVAPQIRMQRTLSDLQKNQNSNGYLGLLTLTGEVFKQFATLQINTLRYQDNKLILEIQANSFSELDLAHNKLEQKGLLITQDQGETKNNQVTARFTIQGQS